MQVQVTHSQPSAANVPLVWIGVVAALRTGDETAVGADVREDVGVEVELEAGVVCD